MNLLHLYHHMRYRTVHRLVLNVLLFYFLFAQYCIGQHTPPVFNFEPIDYQAHQQNWDICQSSDKIMHFANTNGLLNFNGNQWSLHKIKNKIVRSCLAFQDKIYTGAYGEIGYWTKNECADLQYVSLTDKVPQKAIDNEEIWHIIAANNKIYFQSFSVLMVYDGKTIKKLTLPGSIMFLHQLGDRLMFQSLDFGLYEVTKTDNITPIKNTSFFKGKTVTSILPINAGLLITTNSDGIYLLNDDKLVMWNSSLAEYFKEIQINKAIIGDDNQIFLGSIRDGVLIFDALGKLLYHINTSNGLQNNTVLGIYEDVDNNIWIALDQGIDMIKMKSDLLVFHDHKGNLGTVYSAASHDSMLYLGTNQGVYYYDQKTKISPSNRLEFKLVKGTQGQVWQLKKMANGVLSGHNEGSFFIKGTKVKKISSITGGWYTDFLPDSNETLLLQGTYTGFIVLKLEGREWVFSHKVDGYNAPVKKFVIDKKYNLWAIGPNTGMVKMKISDDFTSVSKVEKMSIPGESDVDYTSELHQYRGQTIINSYGKIYYYDTDKDSFLQDQSITASNPPFLFRTIDSVYYYRMYNDSFGIYDRNQQHLLTTNFRLNRDYHNIAILDEDRIVYCLSEGYALGNKIVKKREIIDSIDIVVDKIVLPGSGTCLPISSRNDVEISYAENSFKVFFHQATYHPNNTFYYTLSEDEHHWTQVKDQGFIEFSNLKAGNYSLRIKSNTGMSHLPFNIKVLQPWYLSVWAISFYIVVGFISFHLIKRYFDRKLAQEKRKLEVENERLLREHKIELENNRLIQDNLSKSKELANATMHLVQKNELLLEIKEELIDVRKTGDHTLTAKDFQNLMKLINENMTVQDDKNLFESNFNEVHDQFLKKIKAQFPDLTAADLKLAAYLKMNLASKDIAPLFNISLRGLENKRYRLRKKLNLPNDANLTEFFMSFD